jgi:hypothetical protein
MIKDIVVTQGRQQVVVQRGPDSVTVTKEGCYVEKVRVVVETPEVAVVEMTCDSSPQVSLNETNDREVHLYAGGDAAIVTIELIEGVPPVEVSVGSRVNRAYWVATRGEGTEKEWLFTDIGGNDDVPRNTDR